MAILNRESRAVQNPAIGAFLIWRFCVAYEASHPLHGPCPLPLVFIVLPITLHRATQMHLSATQSRSGLRSFTDKFQETKNCQTDLLLTIQKRALRMRKLTWRSVAIVVSSRLCILDPGSATLSPRTVTPAKKDVPKSVQRLAAAAEKLGGWCGSLTLHEISLALKTEF